MPRDIAFVTFRSPTSKLDQEEVQKLVNESIKEKELIPYEFGEKQLVNTKVLVKIMDIRWITRSGLSFLDFVNILANYSKDKLFTTDLLKSLTHEYWTIYQRKIILRILIPWMIYSMLSILYFTRLQAGSDVIELPESESFFKFIGYMIIVSIAAQLFIEFRQISKDWKDYFFDPYNYNDMFQYFGTLWVVFRTIGGQSGMDLVLLRNLCCFIFLSQGIKAVIDWLRLFDNTSFYVTLILRTMTDIGYFTFIMIVLVLYAGCATYMLQLNVKAAENPDEDNSLIGSIFGNVLVDAVLSQYMLMLGDFSVDGYESHVNTALCFFLFFCTTFFLQITFLNMLIAIMGDTFDRVIEQRPTFSLKNKLMILAGMENIIRTEKAFDDTKIFLYVV